MIFITMLLDQFYYKEVHLEHSDIRYAPEGFPSVLYNFEVAYFSHLSMSPIFDLVPAKNGGFRTNFVKKWNNLSTTRSILDHVEALDSAHQDLNLCLRG